MKKSLLIILLFLTVTSLPAVPDNLKAEVRKGKDYIYQFDVKNGIPFFDSLIIDYPEEPTLYFYKGYLQLLVFSQDMTNKDLLMAMKENFDKCIQLIKNRENYKNSAPDNFYLGLSSGAVGVYYILDRNYWNGFVYGRRAKNYLQQTVKLDPEYYDAYLGLGIYHYYIGLMSGIKRFFAGLLGFRGNTEQGLAEIRMCAEKGDLFDVEARIAYNLIQYFFLNNLDQPLEEFKALIRQYAQNPLFPMLVGYHYRRTHQPKAALPYFDLIDDRFLYNASQVYYMKHYNIAVCYLRLNRFEKSLFHLQQIGQYQNKMTMYFQSAIRYYSALNHLSMGQTDMAFVLLKEIPNKNHTRYWYLSSRLFVINPLPQNIVDIMRYRNKIMAGQLAETDELEAKLEHDFIKNKNTVWYLYYLDYKGFKYYQLKDYNKAERIFSGFLKYIDNFQGTEYFSCWVNLHYGRTLIELGRLEEASEFLEKAENIDDDYMQLIVQREKNRIKMIRGN